jgi:hypothetical protein
VAPALDVRLAVRAGLITDWQIEDPQVEFRGAEQEIEIPERIEVAEIGAIAHNGFVVPSKKHFGSAKCVLDRSVQQPGKGHIGLKNPLVRRRKKVEPVLQQLTVITSALLNT